ncbi:hypothetical protein NDU88_006289 [Pleurodeles waltl]|uniref:Uncharacterized protein n=1 Tax=Pleurodeles waltl TaxID=8319 RepID=A0AAV7PHW4_PLEWA|nr:hypothetical protein NDU88_006289 [Pleurodeles waltl]
MLREIHRCTRSCFVVDGCVLDVDGHLIALGSVSFANDGCPGVDKRCVSFDGVSFDVAECHNVDNQCRLGVDGAVAADECHDGDPVVDTYLLLTAGKILTLSDDDG